MTTTAPAPVVLDVEAEQIGRDSSRAGRPLSAWAHTGLTVRLLHATPAESVAITRGFQAGWARARVDALDAERPEAVPADGELVVEHVTTEPDYFGRTSFFLHWRTWNASTWRVDHCAQLVTAVLADAVDRFRIDDAQPTAVRYLDGSGR